MKNYSIAFVGMGSIGKRHINNVCRLINQQGNTFSIDLYRSSFSKDLSDDIKTLVDNQYLYIQEVQRDYDIVFITNPTSLHLETVLKFRSHTKSFFIEKPVFDTFDVDKHIISLLDEIPSYIACPLRYNPVLQYIKNKVDLEKVISVRAISSSYLPDWRPGQDYRNTYSAHAELGGGVDIDLIHEWDYLTWIFGMPTECYRICGKFSNLEINSNDTALYIAKNDKISYELHLDYFGRKAIRILEIFMVDETILCNLIEGTITYLRQNLTIKLNGGRNTFQMTELRHFFDIIEEKCANDSNVQHGVQVLKLTKAKI